MKKYFSKRNEALSQRLVEAWGFKKPINEIAAFSKFVPYRDVDYVEGIEIPEGQKSNWFANQIAVAALNTAAGLWHKTFIEGGDTAADNTEELTKLGFGDQAIQNLTDHDYEQKLASYIYKIKETLNKLSRKYSKTGGLNNHGAPNVSRGSFGSPQDPHDVMKAYIERVPELEQVSSMISDLQHSFQSKSGLGVNEGEGDI